jgi:hypothetical protein
MADHAEHIYDLTFAGPDECLANEDYWQMKTIDFRAVWMVLRVACRARDMVAMHNPNESMRYTGPISGERPA